MKKTIAYFLYIKNNTGSRIAKACTVWLGLMING